MIDLVGNPEDRFSHKEAQIKDTEIVNNHPLTKNKPIYHARISEKMKWRGFPEPFHLFTFRA